MNVKLNSTIVKEITMRFKVLVKEVDGEYLYDADTLKIEGENILLISDKNTYIFHFSQVLTVKIYHKG